MPQIGLQGQEIRGFLGVNLRKDRLDLADEELAKAINADLHTSVGSVVVRLSRKKQFSSALPDSVIRRLAKINGTRYQVAGSNLYRNQVRILSALSANSITTIVPMRPLNDLTTWAFIADHAGMKKDDGTTARNWGITAPTTKPTIAAGNGNLNGLYSIRYTYVRKTADGKIGHESNPSPQSNEVTLTKGSIVITNFQDLRSLDPQVTHIRVYRTQAGTTLHLFDFEISAAPFPSSAATDISGGNATALVEPTATNATEFGYANDFEADEIPAVKAANKARFTVAITANRAVAFAWESDVLLGNEPTTSVAKQTPAIATEDLWAAISAQADNLLGTAVETDNDPPPVAAWAIEHQEHMFLVRDTNNAHYLWPSKRFRPESFPLNTFVEIGNPDDSIQCAASLGGLLGVWTRQTKYRILGNAVSGFVPHEALSRRGTPSPNSVNPTERGILFAARDGVFLTNLVAPDDPLAGKILPLFFGETVNDFLPINWDQTEKISTAYYKNRIYVSYPSVSASEPDTIAVYSFDTQNWYFYDLPARSLLVEEDVDQFVMGSTDGLVWILEDGTTDDEGSITFTMETKDYFGESTSIRKLFKHFKVDADTDGDSVTASLVVDGVVKATHTISGNRTKELLSAGAGALGYSWRVSLSYTGTKRPRIYGVAAQWLPLEAS